VVLGRQVGIAGAGSRCKINPKIATAISNSNGRQYPMKVRFYVTVDIATDKTALSGKRSKAEEKEYAESVIADLIDVAFKGMNPTNPVVRFPRATK
jgi:hypothetical protein